jgi:hypothetical protein
MIELYALEKSNTKLACRGEDPCEPTQQRWLQVARSEKTVLLYPSSIRLGTMKTHIRGKSRGKLRPAAGGRTCMKYHGLIPSFRPSVQAISGTVKQIGEAKQPPENHTVIEPLNHAAVSPLLPGTGAARPHGAQGALPWSRSR